MKIRNSRQTLTILLFAIDFRLREILRHPFDFSYCSVLPLVSIPAANHEALWIDMEQEIEEAEKKEREEWVTTSIKELQKKIDDGCQLFGEKFTPVSFYLVIMFCYLFFASFCPMRGAIAFFIF
jgi:hypothetical protein